MRNSSRKIWAAAELAERWEYKDPSSVLRIMRRFGISGAKFGTTKQSGRRYTASEVELVERLAGLHIVDAEHANDEPKELVETRNSGETGKPTKG
jgi:hypothetical protein